ncbi:hypothetical protein EJ04DRAFT_548681 [Polyplosphaeria fusca]|uniref:Uncharacterized protein n=1 Tax=Polyplosphaeria fusca TaxID=682080 RepID=A0A9P4RBA4_9PLEO|nr:hypothetical protein EJ04DRAFT_548681 [Polyplosphaeria fusca]
MSIHATIIILIGLFIIIPMYLVIQALFTFIVVTYTDLAIIVDKTIRFIGPRSVTRSELDRSNHRSSTLNPENLTIFVFNKLDKWHYPESMRGSASSLVVVVPKLHSIDDGKDRCSPAIDFGSLELVQIEGNGPVIGFSRTRTIKIQACPGPSRHTTPHPPLITTLPFGGTQCAVM